MNAGEREALTIAVFIYLFFERKLTTHCAQLVLLITSVMFVIVRVCCGSFEMVGP